MSKLALTVITERMDEIREYEDTCIIVEDATLLELLKTRPFLEIFFMSFFSVLIGLFIIGSSKAYGEVTIGNE